jgi:hypothetical protein
MAERAASTWRASMHTTSNPGSVKPVGQMLNERASFQPYLMDRVTKRWLRGMPDKGGIVVTVVDMVDSYFKVVAETLPESIIAVNPFLVRKRMLEIGSEILSRSHFKAFKKTDSFFVFHRSSPGTVRRPSSILDVNPAMSGCLWLNGSRIVGRG